MIKLGDKVKDSITGYTGIATARTEWLFGCVRWCVQPQTVNKEGKVDDGLMFDEPQLKVIKAGVIESASPDVKADRTYGPRNDKLACKR